LDLIAWIGARVGEGLHHAHELTDSNGKSIELVHRDVNASNIFLTYDGHVKLIDFGLVKATNRVSRTAEGIVKGKVAYLSPEQATGKEIDRRTDIFALGITLWELTTDRRLFKAKTDVDTLKAIKDAVIPDPTKLVAGYPPELWKCLKRALAKDPNDRYATVEEFSRDLDTCSRIEGRTVTASTLGDVMRALFGKERERQMAWINEVSAKPKEEPVSVPNPFEAERSFAEMAAAVDLPTGTLVPSSDRGLPDAGPIESASAPKLTKTVEPTKRATPPGEKGVVESSASANDSEKEDRLASTSPGMRSPVYERSSASIPPPKASKALLIIVALVSAGVALALAAVVSSMMK
ncbi:MAG: serine/threonine protein kinase, partial [Polyangiaceae bacterium]